MALADEVRRACAQVAASAKHVAIDVSAMGSCATVPVPQLDPDVHFLEGSREDVAAYLLCLSTINFGSGWFPMLRKRSVAGRPVSGYFTVAWALSDHVRAHGVPDGPALRALTTCDVAVMLGQPADLELIALYTQALRDLGRFLGARRAVDVIDAADGRAQRLAEALATGMPFFADHGYFKRAQIAAHDLAIAGIAEFDDLDELTIFADNLVPHVLRCAGVLRYDDALGAHIDAGLLLPMDEREREIRACAVHACEQIAERDDVAPRVLDAWLWNRGQEPEIKAAPRHRTRCVFY